MNPHVVAAEMLAVGIAGERRAAAKLRDLLDDFPNVDETIGYGAIALAMLEGRDSADAVRAIVAGGRGRPGVLRHAVAALGLAGDRTDVDLLIECCEATPERTVTAAAARAAGRLADGRDIERLAAILADRERTTAERAFAAGALGWLASPDAVPWNAEIATFVNYRALVPTLLGDSAGLLDYD
jgi:HEAT repeat protein